MLLHEPLHQGSEKTQVFKKPNPVGLLGSDGFWGFIGFFGQAGKIGKIMQKLSNLKP